MYTLKLKNAILPDLEVNGDYYVAACELSEDLFCKENLSCITVIDQESGKEKTLIDAVLLDFRIIREHTFFDIREKTEQQKTKDQLANATAAASIAFVVMAEAGTIDEITAAEHIGMFSPWVSNAHYPIGALRQHNGVLYKCVQDHVSQADWTPDSAASLWARAGDPNEEYPGWSQPVGAHDAYGAGDKVSHNGAKWVSDLDGNVWEPGVYGWTEEGGDNDG